MCFLSSGFLSSVDVRHQTENSDEHVYHDTADTDKWRDMDRSRSKTATPSQAKWLILSLSESWNDIDSIWCAFLPLLFWKKKKREKKTSKQGEKRNTITCDFFFHFHLILKIFLIHQMQNLARHHIFNCVFDTHTSK